MSRSVKAATVAASSRLRNAPSPSPFDCEWGGAFVSGGDFLSCSRVCASASGTIPAPATVPAPTAARRNSRRDASCSLMPISFLGGCAAFCLWRVHPSFQGTREVGGGSTLNGEAWQPYFGSVGAPSPTLERN